MQYNTLPLYPELFGRARVSITLMTVELSRTTVGHLLRLWCVLLLAASATGCAKFMYNRLDTLAAWYIGDLVSLDDQQRADWRAWLGQTLEWHRASELGRYATFLREFSAEIAQPAGRDTFQRAFDRVEGFFGDFTAQTAPQATRLLLELTPAQGEELLTNLEEKSNERSEDERDAIRDGKWQAKQIKSTQRQLKRW